MITIRRAGCVAAAVGWMAAASIALNLPQRAWAQADGAGAAAPPSALTGSRLHVEPPHEATVVPEPVRAASGVASESGPAIHAEMGRTARNARKPAAVPQSATTVAFKPAGGKPSVEQPAQAAGPGDEPQGPAAERQAAGTYSPPEVSGAPEAEPAPVAAESPPVREPEMARLPEATAAEMKAGDRQAALVSGSIRPGAVASLVFAPNSAALSGDAEGVLKDLAARFPVKDDAMRLLLMAYASSEDMSVSKARRLSLARALAVRSYLMAHGIDATRMDVQALGDKIVDPAAGSPGDRVDIAMIRR